MNIDWSKAPEGAEFWNPNSELFYRSADGEFQKLSETRGRWTLASGERHEYETLIAKPAPWKGEGLPPVGTVCELKKAMNFTEGTRLDEFPAGTELIVGGHANFYGNPVLAVCVKNRNFTGTLTPECVRPIRTAEQITISAMMEDLCISEKLASVMLARGYRKFEIVEGE